MKFEKLIIKDWRQYSDVEIDFHPRITIITGANGAGKTTILNILSQHFGWSPTLLATPKISLGSGSISYVNGLFQSLLRTIKDEPTNNIGSITYDNKINATLVLPQNGGVAYSLNIQNQQTVLGLHINSHRPIQNYQQISNIPLNAINAEQAFNSYHSELMNKFQGGHTGFSPTYRMKESLISMATFGPVNQNVQRNPVLENLFTNFKNILSKVLPPTVGFLDISIRIPDVVIVTETGEFVIDAASGGVMSIITLAWQIFLFSQDKDEFTVTIDEPENHLHPSMQRSLLRSLVEAFPNAQFVVVTHSPFIVSSVKESSVFVLRYEESTEETFTPMRRRISSVKLDTVNRASSANVILRDVLGIPATIPEWAEDDLQKITKEFSIQTFNQQSIDNLRQQLEEAGLGDYYPDALHIIVDKAS